jgi:hypothetical protein
MVKHAFSFDTPPALLSRHRIKGHPFGIVCVMPHIRRDGQSTYVLTWASVCERSNCDIFYLQETGMRSHYLSKRCPFHRRGTKEQKAKRILKILKEALR